MKSDLAALDFDSVRRLLERLTSTPYGADAARGLEPTPELAVARRMQAAVSSARAAIDAGDSPPLGALPDIRAALRQAAAPGASLHANALHHLRVVLEAGAALLPALRRRPELHAGELSDFEPPAPLLAQLHRVLHASGRLREDASTALSELLDQQGALRQEAEEIIRRRTAQRDLAGHVSDPERVVWHNERAVVRVRAGSAERIKGVRRGSAAGGRDVFVEPLQAVAVNNRIEALSGRIGAEQQHILRETTAEVRRHGAALERLLGAITWLDLALAAGRFSAAVNGHAPELVGERMVDLREAYHPLLLLQYSEGELERVVPLSVRLDTERRILMLTGPNTGGKTVVLKTVGLLVTMAHCGLHLPAEGDCVIGDYRRVMVDVGDRQSLYHHLSTFAGHVEVLKRILDAADRDTLVLLDELGTGTDPEEGAALAMAVLDELAERGVQGIVNTHLTPLKEYAARRPHLSNASMQFDPQRLSPTYRLRVGEPGVSLGLTIAGQHGLPAQLIDRARGYLRRLSDARRAPVDPGEDAGGR